MEELGRCTRSWGTCWRCARRGMAATTTITTTTPHPITRSKRERYSSIACEECWSRKLKCGTASVPGQSGCERCRSQGLQCKITRPQRGLRSNVPRPPSPIGELEVSQSDTRFRQMEDELSLLRRQVAQLTSSYPQQSPSPQGQHCQASYQRQTENTVPFCASQVHNRVEPHFVGTTRPTFTLNIAKASLELMGVPVPHDNSSSAQLTAPPPQHKASAVASVNPLLRLSLEEVQRLFTVFQNEIASSFLPSTVGMWRQKYPTLLPRFLQGSFLRPTPRVFRRKHSFSE